MSRLHRLSAAFAVVLLLFSTQADVYASSHCAHHAAQAPKPAETGHHGHHADPGQPDRTEHAACTCLRMCAGSAAVSLDPTAPAVTTPDVDDVVSRISFSAARLPGFNHRLIPFSTAPPFFS
jgi:hypothetical protein